MNTSSATVPDTNTPTTAREGQQQQQRQQQQQQHQRQQQHQGGAASIFVRDDAPVYDMPVAAINRPLLSEVDPDKVAQFVSEMQAGAQFTPIEVAHVQDAGNNYYFAFGGCHRWAAVKQLGLPTIRVRLIQVSPATINTYLGASSPFRKGPQQQQQQQPEQHRAGPEDQQQQQQPGVDAATQAAPAAAADIQSI